MILKKLEKFFGFRDLQILIIQPLVIMKYPPFSPACLYMRSLQLQDWIQWVYRMASFGDSVASKTRGVVDFEHWRCTTPENEAVGTSAAVGATIGVVVRYSVTASDHNCRSDMRLMSRSAALGLFCDLLMVNWCQLTDLRLAQLLETKLKLNWENENQNIGRIWNNKFKIIEIEYIITYLFI